MNEQVLSLEKQRNQFGNVGKTVFIIFIVWFLSVFFIMLGGVFNAPAGQKPLTILAAIATPFTLFYFCYFNIKSFKDWVLQLDMRHLILLHSWRTVGLGFILFYYQDLLPALFAFPAGLGDAMTAIAAVFLAIAMYQHPGQIPYRRIYLWNMFGLVDFIAAVSLGIATRSGEFLHTSGQVSSDLIGAFPIPLIPAFAVPFYIIIHLIIFLQLRQKKISQTN